jgi:hypothetical protein
MKKMIASLLVLSSVSAVANTMDSFKIHALDTKSKTNYTSLITRVEFNKNLTLDLSQDDDLYFQNGKTIQESEVDKSQSYCQLDTDVEDNNRDYEAQYISVKNGQLLMKKGLIRAIERVDVTPKFEENRIEYDIEFIRSVVKSTNEVVDELECSVPMSTKKALTVKDVKEITGNAFSFDILNLENK